LGLCLAVPIARFEDGRTGVVSATLQIADCKVFSPMHAAA